jgi:hypothetical protein
MSGGSELVRRLRAPYAARKSLNKAASLLHADAAVFYGQLYDTLAGYLAVKFRLGNGAMSFAMLKPHLAAAGVDGNVQRWLEDVMGQCDMARFASVSFNQTQREHSLDTVERIIDTLERM